jgi:hypothetical protein
MTYAEIHPRILPGIAATVVLHARNESDTPDNVGGFMSWVA